MRLIFQIFFILLVAFLLELFLPWWSIAIAACIGGFILKSKYNFLAGFMGIALLWLIKVFVIDIGAATTLAERVAHIFTLPNQYILIMITAFIGGFVGGFSCLTGSLLAKG